MTINIKELLEDYVDKHGELEVDGEYGEQCKPGAFLEKLLETLYSFTFPSREWESSKRALDAKKEEEIWTKRK